MDKEVINSILTNSVTIIIALIAGSVALIQVKSNIISSARIKWQEDLRSDVSELTSITMSLLHNLRIAREEDDQQRYDNYDALLVDFNRLMNKIVLYLRAENEYQIHLAAKIRELNELIDADNVVNITQADVVPVINELNLLAGSVLTEDWKKSRKIYRL